MAPTCQLPIPNSAANRNRCSFTGQETKLQRLKSPGHYAAPTSDPLHQPPRAPSPSARIPELGFPSLWSPQGLTCRKMKREREAQKCRVDRRGGDWKPQLQITKKLKKYTLKLLECHFPAEANSAPQAPRLAGLDHILAGQGCQGRSPGRGQVGAAPCSSHPRPYQAPGPWEKAAGGGRFSDLSQDGTSHGLNRGHRATSRGLGIPQGVGGRRCHLHLLGAAEGSLGFPVPPTNLLLP